MDEKVLTLAGLTRNEAKVYLAVLDIGPALVGIIAKRSGIHRRTVYDLLDRLIEKGLLSYIVENKRKRYEATNPMRIMEMMKQEQEEMEKIIPQLRDKFSLTKEKQETVFYKGKDGVKMILADQLEVGKEILVLGASPQAQEIIKYYFHKYDETRKKKGIRMRMIFQKKPPYHIPLSIIRYLPGTSKTAINIYGTKVAIILWAERPLGILISNSDIAESFRAYFEMLWSVAREKPF